jgi:hypothetical protein
MISEKLQKRIDSLTGGSMRSPAVSPPKDPQSLVQNMPSPAVESTIDMNLAQTMPSVPNTENMSQEDRETLESMLQRAEQVSMAPMSQIAQELATQGEGDDTQLAHLRPGEVVLPPEFFDDEQFENAVEKKFKEFDINPEQAIVGTGIASLNSVTGLEQFGFFKKIGKALKKVAKKIAPVAGPLANFIPGVGPVLAGAIGAGTNLAAGKGLKGAITGGLSGYGTGKLFSGVGSLGKVGGELVGKGGFSGLGTMDKFRALGSGLRSGNLTSTFFNPATGDKGIFGGSIGPGIRSGIGSFTGLGQTPGQQTYDTGEVIGTLEGSPVTRADLANMTPDQIENMQMTQAAVNDKTLMQRLSAKFLPQSVENVLGTGPGGGGIFGGGQGQGGGGGLFSGGFGDALKMGGIGALAAGLGKLAYEDAKKQKGVALTPLTTMSPTGRYNIEAEIARRMGQPEPNPVEFGLLPTGTLPELSGGKPAGMMYGGPVMAYAEGGAVQMQEGGEMDPSMFPRMDGDINGPGTETSDDIPAMLSDGEFVMTGQAVRGAGSYEMQADGNGIISLMPTLEEDRERGMDNMYKMMDMFASKAVTS